MSKRERVFEFLCKVVCNHVCVSVRVWAAGPSALCGLWVLV